MIAVVINDGDQLVIDNHPPNITAVFELIDKEIPKGLVPAGVETIIIGGDAAKEAQDNLESMAFVGKPLKVGLADLAFVIAELGDRPKAILNLMHSPDRGYILSISTGYKDFLVPVEADDDDEGVKDV